jgi:glutathionylspermidine synthase
MFKICLLLFSIFFFSCNSRTNNKLEELINIEINQDSSAIEVKGIDAFILNELKSDSLSKENLSTNLSVFNKVDEDLQDLERTITGHYQFTEIGILFKPDEPFQKNKTYLIELYIQNPNTDIEQQLKRGNSIFHKQIIRKEIQF